MEKDEDSKIKYLEYSFVNLKNLEKDDIFEPELIIRIM